MDLDQFGFSTKPLTQYSTYNIHREQPQLNTITMSYNSRQTPKKLYFYGYFFDTTFGVGHVLTICRQLILIKSLFVTANSPSNVKMMIKQQMSQQRFLITLWFFICFMVYTVFAIEVQTFGHLFHPPAEEKHHKEEKQDLSKIPGVAGVDYPVYHEVPHTSFSCAHVPATPGMYANVEAGCQAYHVCHDGREGHQGASFLCTNGTIFNQKEFACDWWYNVKCEEAVNYYNLNADPEHNPYVPKKKIEVEQHLDHHADGHGFLIHA